MIIDKKMLIRYNSISKELIRHIIDIDSTLAYVDGGISTTLDEHKVLKTDHNFTNEEIDKGTQLVKQYCNENDCLEMYFEYVESVFKDPAHKLSYRKEKRKYDINKLKVDSLKTIEHKDTIFQTEPKNKESISRRINVLSKGEVVNWLDINNQPIKFTDTEFKNFFKHIVNFEQEVILTAAELKKKIDSCTTLKEVDAIKWNIKNQ